MNRPGMTCRALLLAGLALALTGCGKEAAKPSADAGRNDRASETQTAPAITPAPAAAPQTAVTPATPTDPAALLDSLTQALRRYGAEKQKVPASLNDLVAAGYLQSLPQPPTGKKFAIDPKRMAVILQ